MEKINLEQIEATICFSIYLLIANIFIAVSLFKPVALFFAGIWLFSALFILIYKNGKKGGKKT